MNTRKTLYTLAVDNYAPEITELTFPFLKQYAWKIGADFFVIDKRCWPDRPAVMEKLQIFTLSAERRDDWMIYVDADALIHPDLFDITEVLPRDTVLQNASDFAPNRFLYDDIFRRDGRNIGACNWFTVASSWCRDLWHPPDISYHEAVSYIRPVQIEERNGIQAEHLIDDYILSRNIARFGLKYERLWALVKRIEDPASDYLRHAFGDLDAQLGKIGIFSLVGLTFAAKKVLLIRHFMQNWQLHIPTE